MTHRFAVSLVGSMIWAISCAQAYSETVVLKTVRVLTESGGTLAESFAADLPTPLDAHGGSGVPLDGKIYIYGGYNLTHDGSSAPFSDKILAFDIAADTWSENPTPMPYGILPEGSSCAATVAGIIAISPGQGPYSNNGWGTHNRLILFDPTTGMAQEDAAYPYSAIWACQIVAAPNGNVYSFGGWNGGGVTDIFRYDEGSHSLIKVTDLAGGGGFILSSVVADDGRIYLFGGNEWSGRENTIDIFDPSTETSAISAATIPFAVEQSGLRAWYYGGDIIYLADTYPGPTTFWQYRISTDSFESCSMPFAFSTTQAARPFVVNDRANGTAYVIGGQGIELSPLCFDRLSDIDCDGFVTALDLARIIDELFAGGPPAVPCPNGPPGQ